MIGSASWALWPLVASLAGCGSASALPPARFVQPENTIAAARAAGADRDPDARIHLQFAERQYAKAKDLAKNGQNREADWALMGAQADAQLAMSQARAASARNDAQGAAEEVRTLREPTQK